MADGYGAVLLQQQHGSRLAHNITAADNHGFFSAQIHAGVLQHGHNPFGRAGNHLLLSGKQHAGVHHMEAVYIFFRANQCQSFLFIQVRRQGKLHQDAVNGIIFIHFLNGSFQSFLACIFAQNDRTGAKADLITGVLLITHIDLAGRIIAYHDNTQTNILALLFQFSCPFRDLFLNLC